MSDDAVLAAELALGLLPADEARAAVGRALRDDLFAREVEWWRDRLGTLGTADVPPPPHLWRAIATRLADNDAAAPGVTSNTVGRWKIATAAMTAIAASLLGVIVLRPAPVAPVRTPVPPVVAERPATAPLVASLSGARGDVLTVVYDRDAATLVVTPAVLKPGRGDVELWVIPAGATVPVSIGVLDGVAPSRRPIDRARAALLAQGATLAVSLEPKGGSPTGAPTGPVVASGEIKPVARILHDAPRVSPS